MENIHDLKIKSEGKSDVLEAEKPHEPVNEERDMVENDGISELSQDLGYLNALVKSEDSGCDERIHDKTDVSEDDIEDRKCFIQQYSNEEGILRDSIDTISSKKIGTTKCFQHTTSGDLLGGTIQSDCDEKINRVTNSSDDEAEDSKYFIQKYLHEEGKFCNNIDTTSLKNEETTKCFQHTTSVEGNLLGGTIQSGCDEIINRETNLSDDEAEDSKDFIQQYLDDEGKFCNNIDTTSLKNEDAGREHLKCSSHPKVEGEKKQKCQMCDYSTANGVHLRKKNEKKHKSHLCENSTPNSGSLNSHINSVHLKARGEKKHKCYWCDYSTAYSENLKSHITSVHLKVKREKKHKCHLCDYSAVNSSNLNSHIASVHLNIKMHKCHMCDYSTGNISNLNSHIDSVHLNLKKHKCQMCDYSTAYSCSLNRHINKVHLKVKSEKTYKCHLCDYCTVNGGTLRSHINRVHLKVKREKKHKCHLCDYNAVKISHLNIHINSVHLNLKKHKCHMCDYSTAYRSSLNRHINKLHLKVNRG